MLKKFDFGPKLRIRGAGSPYSGQVTLGVLNDDTPGTSKKHSGVLVDHESKGCIMP